MSDRYVHTIWCDDIRQEIGNKPSFMGVYVGGLLLGSVPTNLPRLGIWVWVSTPKDRPLQRIAVRVQRDDGFVVATVPEMDVNSEQVKMRPDATRGHVFAALSISPVEIPEKCRYFEAVVTTESEELHGPKLWVDVNAEALRASGVRI